MLKVNAKSLGTVHTHTHTLCLANKKIKIIKKEIETHRKGVRFFYLFFSCIRI